MSGVERWTSSCWGAAASVIRCSMKSGDTQVVCVAENGRGKYMATLQEVPDEPIADASEDALYEQRLANALAKSRDDFENGRCYTSRESLMATVRAKREAHA